MKTLKEVPCGQTVKVTKLNGEGPVILYFWVYSGTGNDRYLDGHSGGSGIQISVCVDSVPTGKMGDN
jgi:hypothetical protein